MVEQERAGEASTAAAALRKVRKGVVLVVGSTLVLLGLALLVLPGPAFLVLPAGLALLSLEFAWARRWRRRAVEAARAAAEKVGLGGGEAPRGGTGLA